MDEIMMKKVADELVSLSKSHGQEKLKIPRDPEAAMNFIRRFDYRKESEFSIDDPQVITEAERLVSKHRAVLVLANTRDLTYAFYIPSDEGNSGYSQSKSGGGCFIATAIYGSPIAPEVLVFRRFRDEVLLTSRLGSWFVEIYYFVSPPLALLISRVDILKKAARHFVLKPILQLLNNHNKR